MESKVFFLGNLNPRLLRQKTNGKGREKGRKEEEKKKQVKGKQLLTESERRSGSLLL